MMSSSSINEDQTIWLALMLSFLMHGFIFLFSGKTFIQHAQFSVQASSQTVEVSVEEKIDFNRKIATQAEVARNDKEFRMIAHFKAGIKVKANPNYYQNPPPEYPDLARQMRQEGLVLLLVEVNKEGDPVSERIIQSSGFSLLDQAALKVVRHWKFQPGNIDNMPIETTVTIPIRFRLEKI